MKTKQKNIFKMTPAITLDFSARLQKEFEHIKAREQMKIRQEQSYQEKKFNYFNRGKDIYTNPITIQFSDKQVKLIDELVKAKGVSKSAYLRVIIERHLRLKFENIGEPYEQNAE